MDSIFCPASKQLENCVRYFWSCDIKSNGQKNKIDQSI